MATKPVAVGVDGSEESLLAAEWAAMEARRHGRLLRIVSAPAMPPKMHAYYDSPATVASVLCGASAPALEAAVVRAEEVAPGLEITADLLSGAPALAVTDSGAGADLVVIGRHGGPGIGSIHHALLDHARGPVAVVPSDTAGRVLGRP